MNLANAEQARLWRRRTAQMHRDQRRRARRHAQVLDYNLAQLRALVASAEACPYCQGTVTVASFSVDHALPLAHGGRTQLHNLVVCCRRCNHIKGTLTAPEYLSLLHCLDSLSPPARLDVLARLYTGGRRHRASTPGA